MKRLLELQQKYDITPEDFACIIEEISNTSLEMHKIDAMIDLQAKNTNKLMCELKCDNRFNIPAKTMSQFLAVKYLEDFDDKNK